MAFSNMGGGADCSAGANPMSQMLKQFNQDRSLQRDRFDPAIGSSGPQQGMRTQADRPGFQHDDSMVNEFFGQEQGGMNGPTMAPNPFQFSELQRELESVRQQSHIHGGGGDWSAEFGHQGPRIWELKPDEEAAMEKAFEESRLAAGHNASAWREEFMNHPEVAHMNPNQVAEFEQAFQRHFDWSAEFSAVDGGGKGKERMIQLNNNAGWEEQFAAFDGPKLEQQEDGGETEEEMARKVEEAAAAMDPNDFGQFEDLWENMRENMFNDDGGDWEEDFHKFNAGINGQSVYKPDLGAYIFEVVNHFMDHPDPMTEGLRLLEHGTSLNETALAFEAVVQKDPQNSEAWMHLGNIQAQNEKEEAAIRALEMAVETDAGNFPALMSLAVSYTNESYDQAAYQSLERWITQRYPELVGGQKPRSDNPFELHGHVTDLFLTAARQAPEQDMDPDVQVGLGVLFYGSGDLDKAVDCFVSALNGRPNDYLLWNRLGATLANNGRSEEAIDAYHKALELRPSFVRARYNLGVSCINIGCYKEAAEHLLTGLSMHKRLDMNAEEGVNVSSNLWEMLRKAFIMMERRDLADKAVAGGDLMQFKNEFEF